MPFLHGQSNCTLSIFYLNFNICCYCFYAGVRNGRHQFRFWRLRACGKSYHPHQNLPNKYNDLAIFQLGFSQISLQKFFPIYKNQQPFAFLQNCFELLQNLVVGIDIAVSQYLIAFKGMKCSKKNPRNYIL